MKAVYRNSLRSKKLMQDAMIALLKKKPLSEISVTDLVKKADINRGTFYNHYNNPIDIIEEMKDELVEKLASGLNDVSNTGNVTLLLDAISEHVKKNEDDYRIIVKAIPTSFVDNMKSQIVTQVKTFPVKANPLTLYFIVNGIAGLYLDYLKGLLPFTFDQMTTECKKIISNITSEE